MTTGRRVDPERVGRPFVLTLYLAPTTVVVESAIDGVRREPTALAAIKDREALSRIEIKKYLSVDVGDEGDDGRCSTLS